MSWWLTLAQALRAGRAGAPPVALADAVAILEAGRPDEAERLAARLDEDGRTAEAAYLRARCAAAGGDLSRRIAQLRLARAADPAEAAYGIELALALGDGGDPAAALDALEPLLAQPGGAAAGDAALHFRRAAWLHALGHRAAAKAALARALELEPGFAAAAGNLAELEMGDGAPDTARAVLAAHAQTSRRTALLIRRALLLPAAYASTQHLLDTRERFEAEFAALAQCRGEPVTRPEHEIGRTAFGLAYQGLIDRDALVAMCGAIRAHYPTARDLTGGRAAGDDGRRRIGLACAYFHVHSMGRAFVALVEHLRAPDVELHLFGPRPPAGDPLARRFTAAADRFTVLPDDVGAAAQVIAGAALDVLVFPELGMDPFTWFLAHWRMAGVQCACAGHPGTSGIDTIDVYLSDAAAEPAGAAGHYSERLLPVDGLFLPVDDLPAPRAGNAGMAVPAGGARYLCTQTLIKLHPDFDAMLATLLAADPAGEIILFTDPDPHASGIVAGRLRATLGGGMERVRLLQRRDYAGYLDLLASVDVALDTPHFGGGNTTLEALALGIPVVTWPGATLRGRFAGARLGAAGLEACIATDRRDYGERAAALALDPALRGAVRERLRAGLPGGLSAARPAARFATAVRALAGLAARD